MKDGRGAISVDTDRPQAGAAAVMAVLLDRYGADDGTTRYALVFCSSAELQTLAGTDARARNFREQLEREYSIFVAAWRERGCDPPDLPLPAAVADVLASTTTPRRRVSGRVTSRAAARV